MGRKVTDAQIAEALNPALSEDMAVLGEQKFKVITMPLSVEQVFLKKLRSIVPKTVSGPEMIDALIETDVNDLCELAAMIVKNAGEDYKPLTAADILHSARLVDIIGAIEMQIEKQGYLDFLLRITAALPGVLTAKR